MTIIKYGIDEEDIVRRLLTALVSQWDELPPAVQRFCEKHVLDLSRHLPQLRFESRSKFSSRSTAPLPGRMRNAPRSQRRAPPRRHSGPRWRLPLAALGATTIRGTQDGDDGVAHWCLELTNRQAIGRCWI